MLLAGILAFAYSIEEYVNSELLLTSLAPTTVSSATHWFTARALTRRMRAQVNYQPAEGSTPLSAVVQLFGVPQGDCAGSVTVTGFSTTYIAALCC